MPPTPGNPHPIADIDTVLHNANGTPIIEQFFLFQQIAYACFQNQPNQIGGHWQQLYTTAGLYNVNSSGASTTAPWLCPLSTPDNPATPGVVENFALQLDSSSIWDTNGRFTSINGIVEPTITRRQDKFNVGVSCMQEFTIPSICRSCERHRLEPPI
jgi:hypothetical protein